MKNILVAIDFSNTSIDCLEYANNLSQFLKANLFVLNVLETNARESEKGLVKLHRFLRGYPNEENHTFEQNANIQAIVKKGNIIHQIVTTAEENKVDLIIIGTRKKHNIKDYLFGSVSTQLLRKTSTPILIVPEGCLFQKIKKIAFATTNYLTKYPFMEYLQKFGRPNKLEINPFYVQSLPRDFSAQQEETLTIPDPKAKTTSSITIIRNPSTIDGIDFYIQKHQPNLLALYLPKQTKFQKIFHQSLSKKMIYHSEIPLLLISE